MNELQTLLRVAATGEALTGRDIEHLPKPAGRADSAWRSEIIVASREIAALAATGARGPARRLADHYGQELGGHIGVGELPRVDGHGLNAQQLADLIPRAHA